MEFGDMNWVDDPVVDPLIHTLFSATHQMKMKKKKKKKMINKGKKLDSNLLPSKPKTSKDKQKEFPIQDEIKTTEQATKKRKLKRKNKDNITTEKILNDQTCDISIDDIPTSADKSKKKKIRSKSLRENPVHISRAINDEMDLSKKKIKLNKKKMDGFKEERDISQTALPSDKEVTTKNRKPKLTKDKEIGKSIHDVDVSEMATKKKRNHFKDLSSLTPKRVTTSDSKLKMKNVRLPMKGLGFDLAKLQNILSTNDIAEKSNLHDTNYSPKKKKVVAKKPKTLKEKLQEQLKSARFRYLNEQMYTTSGAQAFDIFKQDIDAFNIYHEGFQNQVAKWPENPVKRIIAYVRRRSKKEVIADFGCGEAKLDLSVPNKVHSFDFVAVNGRVTACNMAHVPLESGTIDIGVFCLSLMGTSLVEYLLEAHRVLRHGGLLLITEVISRFEKIGAFAKKLGKLGFILLEKDTSNTMFVWFEFKKISDVDKNMIPKLELQPCIYKKR